MKLALILTTVAAVSAYASAEKVDLLQVNRGTKCDGDVAAREYSFTPSSKCVQDKCVEYKDNNKFSESASCGVDFIENLQEFVNTTPTSVFLAQWYAGGNCKGDVKHAVAVLPYGTCYPLGGTIEDANGNFLNSIKVTRGDDDRFSVKYYLDQACTKAGGAFTVTADDLEKESCINDNQVVAFVYKGGESVTGEAQSLSEATPSPSTKSAAPTTAPSKTPFTTTNSPSASVPAPSSATKTGVVVTVIATVTGAILANSLL